MHYLACCEHEYCQFSSHFTDVGDKMLDGTVGLVKWATLYVLSFFLSMCVGGGAQGENLKQTSHPADARFDLTTLRS